MILQSILNVTWLTLRRGDTSTACLLTVPARPIRVESSRGPLLMMAFTKTWRGFWKLGVEDKHKDHRKSVKKMQVALN